MERQFDLERALKGKRKGGRLDRWCVLDLSTLGLNWKGTVMLGYLHGDVRFDSGSGVKTSAIVAIHAKEYVLETKRTYYELGDPGSDEDRADLLRLVGLEFN